MDEKHVVVQDGQSYIYQCPHCNLFILVQQHEVHCRIFRHAVFKGDMKQVNPHASKENCERYVSEDLVFGCAKPYEMYKAQTVSGWAVRPCDYI